MARRQSAKDPSGAWIAVPGRRRDLPSHVRGRDARGRFARVYLPPRAHYRFYLGPLDVTYWGPGPNEGYRVNGQRVTIEQAQWVIASNLQESIPEPGVVRWKGDLEPLFEDVDEDDKVLFEVNDADMSLEDLQAAYELAGAEEEGQDCDDAIEPEVEFSGDTLGHLTRMRNWELTLREAPFGRWALRDKKIGIAISYYVVAHKMVYADSCKFGVVIRTPFAPVAREAYLELRDRMRLAEEASEEEIEFVVGGFFFIVKVLI